MTPEQLKAKFDRIVHGKDPTPSHTPPPLKIHPEGWRTDLPSHLFDGTAIEPTILRFIRDSPSAPFLFQIRDACHPHPVRTKDVAAILDQLCKRQWVRIHPIDQNSKYPENRRYSLIA